MVFSHSGFVHVIFIIDKRLIGFPVGIISTSEVEELEMRAAESLLPLSDQSDQVCWEWLGEMLWWGGNPVSSTRAIGRDDPGTSRQSGCPDMVFPSFPCCRDVMLNQAALCGLFPKGNLCEPWKTFSSSHIIR